MKLKNKAFFRQCIQSVACRMSSLERGLANDEVDSWKITPSINDLEQIKKIIQEQNAPDREG